PSAVIRIKATSAGVPTKAPTQPAAIPRPALTKKLGCDNFKKPCINS
ncbi:GSCOCG00008034001-RA-CDS, partial [Cotesia congregata]